MSILLQEKRNECQRLINNISNFLPSILSTHLHNLNLSNQDFLVLMKLVKDNFHVVEPHLISPFDQNDIQNCMKIRNILAHNTTTSMDFLNHSIESLKRCQSAFGIQSALVPLRILACKTCGSTITRTAQPSVQFKDLAGNKQRVTRTYDVQVYMVANETGELARRDNTWFPGWIWTYTYCGQCRRNNVITPLGFRYDWAPEDRIDLNTCEVYYSLPHQAMVVEYPNGHVRDLTHVVSDGEVRRHRYALFENRLRQAPYHPH
jgi:hypothetical protein